MFKENKNMIWLFEAILQVIFEPIVYAYFDFIQVLIPQKKLKRWQKNLCLILCGSMFFISVLLIMCGISFSVDDEPFKTYGSVMWITGASIIFINTVLAIIAHILKDEEDANINENIDESAAKTIEGQDSMEESYMEESYDELDIQINDNNEPTPIIYFIDDDELK